MMEVKEARIKIWGELLKMIRPDSRFSWSFSEFIADHEGSDKGAELLAETKMYRKAEVIFIIPDNNLEKFHELASRDKRTVVVTNYRITREFLLIRPELILERKEELASLLDEMSRYWKHQTLEQLKATMGHVDMLVIGASAIIPNGTRFGKGHGYFDLEWVMFYTIELVGEGSVTVGVGRDCQVADVEVAVEEYDVAIDHTMTPTKIMETRHEFARPTKGTVWSRLTLGTREQILSVQELRCRMHCKQEIGGVWGYG